MVENKINEFNELIFVKQLFLHGLDHSQKPGPINRMIAIHNVHNSVEILIKAVAIKFGIKLSRNTALNDLIDKVSAEYQSKFNRELPYKKNIKDLNDHRNSVQHAGDPPSIEIIKKYLPKVEIFLEEVIREIFNIEFDKISILDFIENDSLKLILKKADEIKDVFPNRSMILINFALQGLLENVFDLLNPKFSSGFLQSTSFWIDHLASKIELRESVKNKNNKLNDFLVSEHSINDKKKIKEAYLYSISGLERELSKNISLFGVGIDFSKYMKYTSISKNWTYILSYQKDENGEPIKWVSVFWPLRYLEVLPSENLEFSLNFVIESIFEVQNNDIKIEIGEELFEFGKILIEWNESRISINEI